MGFTWPRGTCHCYIILPFMRRPSGLPNPVYIIQDRKGNEEWNNYSTYTIVQTHKSHHQWVWRSGHFSADLTHGETPPPLVAGETNIDVIYTGPKLNRNSSEGNENKVLQNVQTLSVSFAPAPSNSLTLLLWLIRMLLVKLVNQLVGVFKVISQFSVLVYVVVTGPLDEIMQLPIALHRVEYAVNIPFLCFLDYHWVWFWR